MRDSSSDDGVEPCSGEAELAATAAAAEVGAGAGVPVFGEPSPDAERLRGGGARAGARYTVPMGMRTGDACVRLVCSAACYCASRAFVLKTRERCASRFAVFCV